MQPMSKREKELAVQLGFVVHKGARGGQITNVSFAENDVEHNSPREGNTRPASEAEVKMWRALLRSS